jgi:hypothetical protein
MATAGSGRRSTHSRRGASPPRIYGDREGFKATLSRQIAAGEHLLDELEGLRKASAVRPKHLGKRTVERQAVTLIGHSRLWEWEQRVDRWWKNIIRAASRQLADQVKTHVPHLSTRWDHDFSKRGLTDETPRVEVWLRVALDELRVLRALLGVRRNLSVTTPGMFDELRASGLVEQDVIDGWSKDVASPRTPKQLADAIGASKEVVEATLRSALDRLQVPWKRTDSLQQLMRKWRDVASPTTLDAAGAQQLDQALAALGNLLAFLAEWRNAYGRGHGHPRYAPGLRPHHARLTVDTAEALARFVVLTMDEMARLPPES